MKKVGRRLVTIPFNRIEWTFTIRSAHCIDAAIVDADRHSQSTRLHRSDFAPLIPGCVVSEKQSSNRKSKDVRRLKEHSGRCGNRKTSISREIKKSSKIETGNWLCCRVLSRCEYSFLPLNNVETADPVLSATGVQPSVQHSHAHRRSAGRGGRHVTGPLIRGRVVALDAIQVGLTAVTSACEDQVIQNCDAHSTSEWSSAYLYLALNNY